MNTKPDDRIIVEQGLEARIAAIIAPEIDAMGYRLVRVRISGLNGMTVQIMAERPDGTMDVNGCEEISRAISPVLDIEDPISAAYHLEVSSPGIDRPMVRLSDFANWVDHVVKLETRQMINGRKRYKGTIVAVKDDEITFRREEAQKDDDENFILRIGDIAEAKLVLTDDLISEALRRDKALRKANGMEEPDAGDDGAPDVARN